MITILSVVGPVVTLLHGAFIDLASVADILHVCVEITENNGIEVTIEKRKEVLPQTTGEMSEDERSENVQQSLKNILHRQGSRVSIHS